MFPWKILKTVCYCQSTLGPLPCGCGLLFRKNITDHRLRTLFPDVALLGGSALCIAFQILAFSREEGIEPTE